MSHCTGACRYAHTQINEVPSCSYRSCSTLCSLEEEVVLVMSVRAGGKILVGVGGAEVFFLIFFIIKQHNLSLTTAKWNTWQQNVPIASPSTLTRLLLDSSSGIHN